MILFEMTVVQNSSGQQFSLLISVKVEERRELRWMSERVWKRAWVELHS